MSIVTSLAAMAQSKTDITDAILNKGGIVNTGDGFLDFAADINTIPTGAAPAAYAPPEDWINIDTITPGNINLLVSDGFLATYAFICSTSTGTYHVDWGDGASANFTSGAVAQHVYTAGTGQACSRGYTTFKIVISPNTGNLTAFAVTSHTVAGRPQTPEILGCVIAATYLTSLISAFYKATAPTVKCLLLEYCKISTALPYCLNTVSMFNTCYALQSVDLSGLVAVTTASTMFAACYSLQTVDASSMGAVTNATSMFNTCYALRTVDVSGMSSVTNATTMFSVCHSLQEIDISGMTAIINAYGMFTNCFSLHTITFGSKTAITSTGYMFESCYALQAVSVGNMNSVTSAINMFFCCYALQLVDVSGMTAVTNASSMFENCYNLQIADVSGMVAVVTASCLFKSCYALRQVLADNFSQNAASVTFIDAFTKCEQLTSINFPTAKMIALHAKGESGLLNKLATISMHANSLLNAANPTMDLQYNTLTAAQLDTIYTALPTVVAKTINVTGCTGQAASTKSIATAKGWTVTPA